jgi:hypothetical protein
MENVYSTRQAARRLNVSLVTLQRHVSAQTFPAPKLQKVGGVRVRLWGKRDLEQAKKALSGIRPGRKKKL